MGPFVDYYKTLGVEQNATDEEIKDAYRKQSIKWHPDKNRNNTTKIMQDINEANRILSDATLRTKYDRLLNEKRLGAVKKEALKVKPDVKNIRLKSDRELFAICRNSIKYPLEYLHDIIVELKKRLLTDNIVVIMEIINKLKK